MFGRCVPFIKLNPFQPDLEIIDRLSKYLESYYLQPIEIKFIQSLELSTNIKRTPIYQKSLIICRH